MAAEKKIGMVREVQDRQPLFHRLATFFTKRMSNTIISGEQGAYQEIS
jgi:hypothetical protein